MVRVFGHAQRTFSESVPAQPDDVRDYCVDLSHIPDVHPDGTIRVVSDGRQLGNDEWAFRVRDGFAASFLTVPLIYTVRLHVPVAGAVTADTRPLPTVRLDCVVAFEAIETGTRLKEHLRVSAPRPLVGMVTRRAFLLHTALLAGVRRHFETQSSD